MPVLLYFLQFNQPVWGSRWSQCFQLDHNVRQQVVKKMENTIWNTVENQLGDSQVTDCDLGIAYGAIVFDQYRFSSCLITLRHQTDIWTNFEGLGIA